MGRRITITTSRGGAGKTSLCRVLSANLARQGRHVAVCDADPNATFARWHRDHYTGPAITCITEAREEEIVRTVRELSRDHDLVLTDTAGFGNRAAGMAAGDADLVLIPLMADRDSVVEVARTARLVASFAEMRDREIAVRIVKSRWRPNGLAERATLDDLQTLGLTVLNQHLSDLTEYQKLTFTGQPPVTGRIAAEVEQLIAELVEMGIVTTLEAA